MSIKLIARDLYRMKTEVARLEKEIERAPRDRQDALIEALRRARADLDRLERMLDGAKTPPDYRQPR